MKEGGHMGDLGVDEKIMLNWCSGDRMGGCGLYLSGSGQEPVVGNIYVSSFYNCMEFMTSWPAVSLSLAPCLLIVSVSESLSSISLCWAVAYTDCHQKQNYEKKLSSLKLNLVCVIFFILSDWWLFCIDRNISWYKYQEHENNCHIWSQNSGIYNKHPRFWSCKMLGWQHGWVTE